MYTRDPRYAGEHQLRPVHSNENYYAVIVSIESGPTTDEANPTALATAGGVLASPEAGRPNGLQGAYFIRVRFDDRSDRSILDINRPSADRHSQAGEQIGPRQTLQHLLRVAIA